MATNPKLASERWEVAWRGFAPGIWQSRVNVRDFIQRNYTPYEGDGAFLQGATERTKGMWKTLQPLLAQGAREGHPRRVAGALRHPRARARLHRQGPRDHRRPADRRAAQARDHAVRRLARGRGEPRVLRLQAGPGARRDLHQVPQDAQRRRVRRLHAGHPQGAGRRASSPACRMPTAAAASSATTAGSRSTAWISSSPTRSARSTSSTTAIRPRTSSACARSWPSRSASLKELKEMAKRYGYDISGPATNAREAVQWTYFGYLGAIKQQNGAAMSAGRLSTFWDIYFERDLREGKLTEPQAQEIIDDLVIKWRIVRFLRAPEYNQLFSGDPVWVTEVVGGMGEDGRTLVTKTRVPHAAHALQPRPGARAQPHRVLVDAPARRLQALRDQDVDRHELDPVRVRRPDAAEVRRRLRDRLLRLGDAGRQADAVLRRAREPGQDAALRPQRRTRRGDRRAGRAEARAGHRRRARLRRGDGPARPDDGLAGEDLRQRAQHHPLHARQVLLRGDRDGAARPRHPAHAGLRHRRPVARRRQPVGDQVREGEADPRRARAHRRLQDRGRVPVLRQQRRPRATTSPRCWCRR